MRLTAGTMKPLLPDAIQRLISYQRRHGLKATMARASAQLRRLWANRMLLFCCDLVEYGRSSSAVGKLPEHLTVERKNGLEDLEAQDAAKIMEFWNPEICRRQWTERFQAGASMWLIRFDGAPAGYGWTIAGRTIEPHYCPLIAGDVHLFDFLVLPQFRGRQINPSLVHYILGQMADEGKTRAYIEVAEWNLPQRQSLRRMPFRFFGIARKASLFGRTVVEWAPASSGATNGDSNRGGSPETR
jgi:GNAT superfamily N-acetyltransferase